MTDIQFAAPCLFGLEGIAGDELRRLNVENVRVEDRRVLFTGDMHTLAKANICLRTAERVHIVLAQFEAKPLRSCSREFITPIWRILSPRTDSFPSRASVWTAS